MGKDTHLNPHWLRLHQRVALGEMLTPEEQAGYLEGCRELDAEEVLDGGLERLRRLREDIARAEVEQQGLREREADLDKRIAALEARLDQHTRQALGISK